MPKLSPESDIHEILPQSIQQWQKSPCIAEENGKKMLECIHHEQQDTHARLKDMECYFHELEAIILCGCRTLYCPMQNNKHGGNSVDLQIFCVSCGKPINVRIALCHMECCFARVRSLTWGRWGKTPHFQFLPRATRLFCDVYNPQSERYCKQLQPPRSVPHHHHFCPQVPDDKLCSCPLVHNVFEVTNDFCHLPKRFCNLHYCWEKLRRAEVDLECVHAFISSLCVHKPNFKRPMVVGDNAALLGGQLRYPFGVGCEIMHTVLAVMLSKDRINVIILSTNLSL
ncbi:hypothetical protein E5288_WYG002804 [Bos mutus]|uniref:CXXC-type zinc finger protein 1 n=1 Tax=Bos mutus TaxID=72004 RepID=A0A6B0SEL6_9CETA|nr:hypothetical protein [Bos mutus]